jgi:hypothetical protein
VAYVSPVTYQDEVTNNCSESHTISVNVYFRVNALRTERNGPAIIQAMFYCCVHDHEKDTWQRVQCVLKVALLAESVKKLIQTHCWLPMVFPQNARSRYDEVLVQYNVNGVIIALYKLL